MSETFLKKAAKIKDLFAGLTTSEERYKALIKIGRNLSLSPALKRNENLVSGCQSSLYLVSRFDGKNVFFEAHSDALISAGLAALLISVYSEESPETVLTQPPTFLSEIGLHMSLSPSRSNGLNSIYLRIKQEAVKFLLA